MGEWSVDIKERLKFLTDEPDNAEMYRIVIRGTTHQRQRPENSQRFGGESLIVPLSKRDMTKGGEYGDFSEQNWLGKTWMREFNNSKMASLNQI